MGGDKGYLHLLTSLLPGSPPVQAAYEFLPWFFRTISLLCILPVIILLAADFLTYLYFRAVYQPFGRARTAYYKAGPVRWGSRPASAAPSPPGKTKKLPLEKSAKAPPSPRSPSAGMARDIGVQGPLLDPASPGVEDMSLPMIDDDSSD